MYTVFICDCAFIEASDPGMDSVHFDNLTEDEMQFLLRLAADRSMDVVVRKQEETTLNQAEENACAFVARLVERANQCENPRAVLETLLAAAEAAIQIKKEETT